jgi:hypothetical protein
MLTINFKVNTIYGSMEVSVWKHSAN